MGWLDQDIPPPFQPQENNSPKRQNTAVYRTKGDNFQNTGQTHSYLLFRSVQSSTIEHIMLNAHENFKIWLCENTGSTICSNLNSSKMLQKFILCSVCSADNTIHHCSPKTMLLILALLAYVWASNTYIHSIMIVLYTLWISYMQLQTEKHTFNIWIEKLSKMT